MGCGLRKIRQTEDSSPGKIYSTLKRPQVETKIGVTYTYCHLDFLVGKEDGTSTLCLSSVRELPSQLQDLYQQGFVLTVVHPFVHPCGQEPASIQQQLYRVVLTKLPDSSEKSPSDFEPYHLKLEECLSAEHIPMAEHIQGYVKKIQDAADLGITFAGFVQEPAGIRPRTAARAARGEPALSLHSSPSSLRSSELTASPSHQGEPDTLGEGVAENGSEDWRSSAGNLEAEEASGHAGGDTVSDDTSAALTLESFEGRDDTPSHNNNKAKGVELSDKTTKPSLSKNGVELFGLFNYPGRRRGPLKYYTVKVPLRVRAEEAGMPAVEADWLDHMTQHFNGGASLVDGYFHLGNENDKLPKVIEGVFVFQEAEPSTSTAYDAIVVEQWSVVDGVQVKTDYIPLLESLASFGWRLTCVLPTPIVKTNSNGSLSTKQIVFLQRPALPAKKRQSKKLIFRTRNKSGKNSVKDAPKNKKKKNAAATAAEKELEGPKLQDGAEKPESANEMTGASEGRGGQSDGELAQEGVGEGKKRSEGRGEVETEVSREGGVELAGQRQDEQAGKTECDDQAAEVKDGEMESEEGGSDRNKESPQTCRQQESGEGQKQSANDSSWENQQESSITVDGSAPAANGSPANQE
ncbi:raftlin isoform X2 [Electrophorus electricus]|uniref:raftlin isoform X2 n=1 Tax=Electrophorus electricus TaxID=8005 RepID=UPI0015D08EF3|nr:raftlin isoform X2 [Electrophorus electricus]